jgi:hypothetical protein
VTCRLAKLCQSFKLWQSLRKPEKLKSYLQGFENLAGNGKLKLEIPKI